VDRANVASESSTNDAELRRLLGQTYAMSDSVIAALLLFVTTNKAEWATVTYGRGSTLINGPAPPSADGYLDCGHRHPTRNLLGLRNAHSEPGLGDQSQAGASLHGREIMADPPDDADPGRCPFVRRVPTPVARVVGEVHAAIGHSRSPAVGTVGSERPFG
jgi:hypothetical protein